MWNLFKKLKVNKELHIHLHVHVDGILKLDGVKLSNQTQTHDNEQVIDSIIDRPKATIIDINKAELNKITLPEIEFGQES